MNLFGGKKMWTLGVMMMLIVTGDCVDTIKGILGENVTLPCVCKDRNLEKPLKWQKTVPQKLVLNFSKTVQSIGDDYTNRVSPTNEGSDCSILLRNISTDDHGEYKCIFYQNEKYLYKHVNLHICGSSQIQKDVSENNGLTVFKCSLEDCFEDEVLEWTLNGTLIENSSIHISHDWSWNNTTGLFNSNTQLSTKLNLHSKPECERAKPTGSQKNQSEVDNQQTFVLTTILVVLVVLVALVSVAFLIRPKSNRRGNVKPPYEPTANPK